MKIKFLVVLLMSVLMLIISGCSSKYTVAKVKNQGNQGISEIDGLIVGMKKDFYERCYEPLMSDPIPENECQHQLFGVLERRYRHQFNDKFMSMAANDIFFKDVKKQVDILIKTNKNVRNSVKRQYSSLDELMNYYQDLYQFKAN